MYGRMADGKKDCLMGNCLHNFCMYVISNLYTLRFIPCINVVDPKTIFHIWTIKLLNWIELKFYLFAEMAIELNI